MILRELQIFMMDHPEMNPPKSLEILLPFEVSNLFKFVNVLANWHRSNEINCDISVFTNLKNVLWNFSLKFQCIDDIFNYFTE